MDIKNELAMEFTLQKFQVSNTIELFDEGATVPFISRYRKERTGSLTEIQLRDLERRYKYFTELEERRNTILESIREQGKLTPLLQQKIEATKDKVELEDLYLPYKPKRVTRGKKARDAGLEPLARWLVACSSADASVEEEAKKYVNDEAAQAGFDSVQKIIKGACDVLAEELSDNADIRKWLREYAVKNGTMSSRVKNEFAGQKTKFDMYHDFNEAVLTLPSHRILAMFRGEKEGVLRVALEYDQQRPLALLCSKLIVHPQGAGAGLLQETAQDAFDRLLSAATETEVRRELRERAENEAFKVFGENLRALLMAPPAGRRPVLGIDPGFRTGCKVVAVDDTGKLREFQTIYPTEPRNDIKGATAVITRMIAEYAIELIAIGNGTAGRETERFIRELIRQLPEAKRPICIIVNESGASVYSASEAAVREFPDQDVTVRGSVSIARRLQDPLAELVKIDPKSIGVGQYQHDVHQTRLRESLEEVVESCVNRVGVDLNLASTELLQYVSGLTNKTANSITNYRNEHGAFASRSELKRVPGVGEKAFEQSAGFLRIRNGVNPLDNSAVHPERYEFVVRVAEALDTTLERLIGNIALLKSVDKKKLASEEIGLPTIEDIFAELEKPGRDPREEFRAAALCDGVNEITDLKPGMKLEGTVTNVTNFGAFVDVGVHQDGLVHISELADHFVKDPTQYVKAGQIVQVTVREVDQERRRISLSMKKEPGDRRYHEGKAQQEKTDGKKETMHEKITQWKGKNGGGDKKLITAKPKFSIKQLMR